MAAEKTETGPPLGYERRRTPIFILFAAALILLLPGPLFLREMPLDCAALNRARDVLMRMQPFRAMFVQQVYYDDDLAVEEEGDLLYCGPQRVKWTYRRPELKIFILENARYRFFEPEARQLTIGGMEERQGGWIWQLLFSKDADVVESCPQSGSEMVLKDPHDGTRFHIRLDRQNRIVRVEHIDSGGARHVYLLSRYQERVEVDEDEFSLEIPPDTEIVNMDAESP